MGSPRMSGTEAGCWDKGCIPHGRSILEKMQELPASRTGGKENDWMGSAASILGH
jgi:hypothetical protein